MTVLLVAGHIELPIGGEAASGNASEFGAGPSSIRGDGRLGTGNDECDAGGRRGR